jgi:hypothetical protein
MRNFAWFLSEVWAGAKDALAYFGDALLGAVALLLMLFFLAASEEPLRHGPEVRGDDTTPADAPERGVVTITITRSEGE